MKTIILTLILTLGFSSQAAYMKAECLDTTGEYKFIEFSDEDSARFQIKDSMGVTVFLKEFKESNLKDLALKLMEADGHSITIKNANQLKNSEFRDLKMSQSRLSITFETGGLIFEECI